jgi:hypothetical protein
VKQWLTILCLVAMTGTVEGQGCFAKVSLDRRSVYVQQPFKVTITVLTPTWYTAPLDFDNIQIPSAFILPFDRTMPGMFDINGKKYAGLQFYYIVFPYKAGSFTIPSLDIIAQTPAEGSSESRKVRIKTPAEHFTVKAIPENAGGKNWFVAKNVFVHETWSKPLKNLKVGDIVERTITIDAKGTLPQFIPQLPKDSLAFASTYLQDAELKDERDDYDANGRLTQSVIYLLEKEGDFTIPAVAVQWWNPNNSKLYSKHAFAGNIHVKPNPNLGMLASLKDSLAEKQAATAPAPVSKKLRTIFGIPWYWALLIVVAGIWVLYRLIAISLDRLKTLHAAYRRYMEGETHAFRLFLRSPMAVKSLVPKLYRWWDKFSFPGKSASVTAQLLAENKTATAQTMQEYLEDRYRKDDNNASGNRDFKKAFRVYRKEVKKGKHISAENKISAQQTGVFIVTADAAS